MATTRLWLSGFLLLGVLPAMLGPLLVVWQYHIDVDPGLIGLHFFAFNAGYVTAAAALAKFVGHVATTRMVRIACGAAFLSLILLFLAAPPAPVVLRLAAIAAVGLSAGALSMSLLYGAERSFREAPAVTITRASTLFSVGCLLTTLLIAATYSTGSAQVETALLASVPLVFLAAFAKRKSGISLVAPRKIGQLALPDTLRDLRSIAIVLFKLLLFFQFGSEWTIAGWLPLFLVHRLGSNPALAIAVLSLYFFVLMLGRLIAQKLLPRLHHSRYLVASVVTSLCGFLLLGFAPSLLGAAIDVVIIAAGFAPIYPLIAEQLDDRFSFQPGFYNGAVSIAVTGAMSAPFLVGLVAGWLGMSYVMLLPAFGSLLVLVFSLLLMFEAHLMDDRSAEVAAPPLRNAR